MTTKLTGTLRREIEVSGALFTILLDPKGLKLVSKGRRKGLTLEWQHLISGEAALATALQASLTALPIIKKAPSAPKKKARPKPDPAKAKSRRRMSR